MENTRHRRWSYSRRRLQFGMVAGFKSESRPASLRNTWPECVGICTKDKEHAMSQKVETSTSKANEPFAMRQLAVAK